MEKVGFAKRDILASRVVSARDSQLEAKEEISDALTEFGKVVSYQGGDLEAQYKRLAAQLEDSEEAARAVAGLKGEVTRVDAQVNQLVAELNRAIAEANRFIADLEKNGG
jgi:ABC-type transporter Mla subunit MlaD